MNVAVLDAQPGRFNLASIIRQNGRRSRKPIKLRPIDITASLWREAQAIDVKIVNGWRKIAIEALPIYEAVLANRAPLRDAVPLAYALDAANSGLSSFLRNEGDRMSRVAISLEPELNSWQLRVEEWHRKRFTGAITSATGVNVFPFLASADVQEELDAALESHAALIKDLNADLQERVTRTIWSEYVNQTPRREIGKMLQEQLRIGRRRANNIAKDQTLKLSGELEKQRQLEAGITKYIWRTAEDERVRPTHAARNGKVYEWNGPGIKPREEINCRCTGQAYIDGLSDAR